MGRLTGGGVGAPVAPGVGVGTGLTSDASVIPEEVSVPVRGGNVLVVVVGCVTVWVPPNPYRLRGVVLGFCSGVHAVTKRTKTQVPDSAEIKGFIIWRSEQTLPRTARRISRSGSVRRVDRLAGIFDGIAQIARNESVEKCTPDDGAAQIFDFFQGGQILR